MTTPNSTSGRRQGDHAQIGVEIDAVIPLHGRSPDTVLDLVRRELLDLLDPDMMTVTEVEP